MRDEILESLEWFEVMECPEAFNCIYMWRNKANEKLYVGQAKDFRQRTKIHKRASFNENQKYKYNVPLHSAIRKYGIDNFEICILEKNLNDYDEMNEKEIYYIEKFDTLANNKKGYNIASGGGSANPYAGKTEEEMRKFRKKMSEINKGENHPNYGKKHSEETKQKMSEANKGKNNSNLGSLIVQVDKLTNRVVNVKYNFEFVEMGFYCGHISKCCKGKRKTHKDYRWFYLEDYIQQFGTIENHSGI